VKLTARSLEDITNSLFKHFIFHFVKFAVMKNRLLFVFIALTSLYAKKGLGQCVKSTPYTQNFDGSNWVAQSSWLNSGSNTCKFDQLQLGLW
jgi:hypothetical protein